MRIATGGVTWGSEAVYYWLEPPAFEPMLYEIVAAGYRAIERSSNFPTDPAEVRRLLGARGITFVAAWSWVDLFDRERHSAEVARVTQFGEQMREIGAGTIILSDEMRPHRIAIAGRVTPADALSDAEHRNFVDGLHRIGEALAARGLRTVYHPHAGTSVETRRETDRLLAALDPALVGYCPDTGHIAYAGDDPVAAIVDYADRVAHVHVKDVDQAKLERARTTTADFMEMVRLGVFTALGKGTVDLRRAIRSLKDVGYDRWIVVEQDAAAHPFEDAVASREFIESVIAG
jgi:inosose dehydratase